MKRRDFITKGSIVGAGVVGVAALSGCEDKKEVAAPAVVADKVEIAMVSTWPRDFPGLGTGAQRFAQRLSDVSDGRIQVTYYAAGERVGAFDSFDEVASGNAQAYHAADYYWKGKHPGWAYFTAVPFGLTYPEMKAWLHWMGGQELHDELAGEFGLKCVPMGNTGVNGVAGSTKKSIGRGFERTEDAFGPCGDVMANLCVSSITACSQILKTSFVRLTRPNGLAHGTMKR